MLGSRSLSYLILGFVFSFALLSCQSPETKSTDAKSRENSVEQNQTHSYAMTRSAAVRTIEYNLDVTLNNEDEKFSGKENVTFELLAVPYDLALDFRGGDVQKLVINGKPVAVEHHNGRISLPGTSLQHGTNQVAIEYTQSYSKSGRGLYRFKDPADGKVYLYSQFEAFDANHMFPCFDQPDLKAIYHLEVSAPKDWEVVSTTLETKVTKPSKAVKHWVFAPTPVLSPYVFSLHAGPYKVWKSQAGRIPLRLFARQSMARYIHPEYWFKITQQGLKFYGDYFAYPYPFKKYDQLIVPDFNAGAMENVAAVTFTERFAIRGTPTILQKEGMAGTILHEMAHMWFGDLVTMKWWNGLWLNESFATYMSSLSMQRATEFKNAWLSFNRGEKRWAYFEDQLVTTHAINGAVPDTDSAFTNFDGITYGKGAAVLKQLAFYLGEKNFQSGVQAYFKKYEYQNTTLADFIGSLERASGLNLANWSDLWLEKSGLETVSSEFTCDKGKIATFNLHLEPPVDSHVLRPHRTRVALFEKQGGGFKKYQTEVVNYSEALTPVPALVGANCPAFVYPNEDDQDYVKVSLDPVSLETAKSSLASFSDGLMRLMIWPDLFEMVRDQKLPIQDYADLVYRNLPKEKDYLIASGVVGNLAGNRDSGYGSVLFYFPQTTPAEITGRKEQGVRFENLIWGLLEQAPGGSDWQKLWLDNYVRLAESPDGLKKIDGLLTGKINLKGLVLDQDRRWAIVKRLNSFAAPQSDVRLTAEKKRDSTENGIQEALASETARPNAESKKTLLEKAVLQNSDLTLSRKRSIIGSAFPMGQEALRAQYGPEFFANLAKFSDSREPEFLSTYTQLKPSVCTNESLKEFEKFLSSHSSLPPVVLKSLKVTRQEESRCVRVRAKAAESVTTR